MIGGVFEILQYMGEVVAMKFMELGEHGYLVLFFGFGGADDFAGNDGGRAFGREKGVDAHDGEFAGVFEGFVVEGFVLDFAALIGGFHGTQHAAAFGDALEFGHYGFFYQLGEFFDDEGALVWVLVFGEAEFVVDDHLNGHGTAHGFLGGRGDGFVVGVSVERIAVVVDGIEGLEGGADVVEADFLCMERAAGGLDVVFELLRTEVGLVFIFHGFCPNGAGHATDDGEFDVDAIGEKEGEVGCKFVDMHAARQVVFDVGEAVGKGESELGDGVGACFGNVIAGNGDGIEVADVVVDEIFLNIAHEFERKIG